MRTAVVSDVAHPEDLGGLEALIEGAAEGAGALVCLEPSGVTGHPDHQAVAAAIEAVAPPFPARLARFVSQVRPLARPDSGFAERQRLLDLLIAFSAATTWPDWAFDRDPDR